MSWNINFMGRPDSVIKAIEAHSDKISGQSKVEYDKVKPAIIILVNENFDKKNDVGALQVIASGHGHNDGTEDVSRQCAVEVKRIYGLLV